MTDSFSDLKSKGLDIEPTVCAKCGYCSFVCPAYLDTRWDSQSPRGKIQQLRLLIKQGKPIPEDFAQRIFDCTLCGMCQEVCQTNIPLLRFWQEIRKEIGNLGIYPEVVNELHRALDESDNIMDMDQEDRIIWMDNVEELVADRIKKNAEVAYYLGCNISYKGSLVSTAENTVRILDYLGVDFTVLGDEELCCGNPYFIAGKGEQAKELAARNLESLKRLGVSTVVFNCPGCHRVFSQEYEEVVDESLLEGIEFLTLSEFLDRKLKEGKLKFEREVSHIVTWHDPCELGRYQGIYRPPRDVLTAIPGLELREMKFTQDESRCCGGGGLLKGTNPEMSLRIGAERIAMAAETGASIIVSECPSCRMSLNETIELADAKIEYRDLSEMVVEALGLK